MSNIHPSSIIENGADIADDVTIGPFCHISENVSLASGVILESNIVVQGNTKIASNTRISPFTAIGTPPQDLKFKGEESELIIGKNNRIREHVTINPGTEGGGMKTVIGDNCLLMVGSHVAHDCQLGSHVILANNATIAGHVTIGDYAVIGGLSAIHQFVRIGEHAMIGGMSGIDNDVIPYGQANGERANLVGLNLVGLKRRGFDRDSIHDLRGAYRMLFSPEGTLNERIDDVEEHFGKNAVIMNILDFMRDDSSRSICQPKNGTKSS